MKKFTVLLAVFAVFGFSSMAFAYGGQPTQSQILQQQLMQQQRMQAQFEALKAMSMNPRWNGHWGVARGQPVIVVPDMRSDRTITNLDIAREMQRAERRRVDMPMNGWGWRKFDGERSYNKQDRMYGEYRQMDRKYGHHGNMSMYGQQKQRTNNRGHHFDRLGGVYMNQPMGRKMGMGGRGRMQGYQQMCGSQKQMQGQMEQNCHRDSYDKMGRGTRNDMPVMRMFPIPMAEQKRPDVQKEIPYGSIGSRIPPSKIIRLSNGSILRIFDQPIPLNVEKQVAKPEKDFPAGFAPRIQNNEDCNVCNIKR